VLPGRALGPEAHHSRLQTLVGAKQAAAAAHGINMGTMVMPGAA